MRMLFLKSMLMGEMSAQWRSRENPREEENQGQEKS
jgi:hypothetical protein